MTDLGVLKHGLLQWRCVNILHKLDHVWIISRAVEFFAAARDTAVPNVCLHALDSLSAKHQSHKITCSSETFTVMAFTSDSR